MCCGFAARGQQLPKSEAGGFYIQNYPPEVYDGENPKTFAITQDDRGFIYVGSGSGSKGALVFDGATWRRKALLGASPVYSIAKDIDANIYLGGVKEFGTLVPDTTGTLVYKGLSAKSGVAPDSIAQVWSSHYTPRGVVFQTDAVLIRYNQIKKTYKTWRPETSFFLGFEVNNGYFVHDLGAGLKELVGDSLKMTKGGAFFAGKRIYSILPYGEQSMLVVTLDHGLFLYENGEYKPFETPVAEFLSRNRVSCGLRLRDGNYALGTHAGGVVIINRRGEFVSRIDESSGLQSQDVNNMFQDKEGGLWLALGYGVARVENPMLLARYADPQQDNSHLNGEIKTVIRHGGIMYVGTSRGVFYRPEQQAFPSFKQGEFLPVGGASDECHHLIQYKGKLLAATRAGVLEIRGAQAYNIMPGRYALFLYPSRSQQDLIFVGLEEGLASLRLRGGKWQAGPRQIIRLPDGAGYRAAPFREMVRSLAESSDSILWIGANLKGVYSLSLKGGYDPNRSVKYYNEVDKLFPIKGNYVYEIYGEVYFCVPEQGLTRFNKQTGKMERDSSLGDLFVSGTRDLIQMTGDGEGNIWIATEELPTQSRNRVDPPKYRVYILRPDGKGGYITPYRMPFTRFLDFPLSALYPETSGLVWVGGTQGLFRYNQKAARDNQPTFHTHIREVLIQNNRFPYPEVIFGGTYFLSPDNREIVLSQPSHMTPRRKWQGGDYYHFEVAAPSFDAIARTEYRFKLKGFEEYWSDWTRNNFKDYAGLDKGEYELIVQARNVHGDVSETASYKFIVRPPFWDTWYAWAIYALLGLFIVFAAIRFRTLQLQRQNKLLEDKVDERTREVEEQKEQLEKQNKTLIETNEVLEHQRSQLEKQRNEIEDQNQRLSVTNLMLEEQKEKVNRINDNLKTANENVSKQNAELAAKKQELEGKNEELTAKQNELQQAYEDLKHEQEARAQAQKMAALGEIAPIVAHEINTPVSAIKGSVQNVTGALPELFKTLPEFSARLNDENRELLWTFIDRLGAARANFSSREERKFMRDLEGALEDADVEPADETAELLVKIGLVDDAEPLFPLLKAVAPDDDLRDKLYRIGVIWKQMKTMSNAAEKAQLIVSSLQSYVTRRTDDETPVPTNLAETIQVVLTLYDYYLRQGIEIELSFPQEPVMIMAIPHELKQVWTNLIMSAVYAMEMRGNLAITVRAEDGAAFARFADSGPKLTPEQLGKIFEPGENARDTEPAISLAICQRIIEEHEGTIAASGGEQNVFEIRLPLAPDED